MDWGACVPVALVLEILDISNLANLRSVGATLVLAKRIGVAR